MKNAALLLGVLLLIVYASAQNASFPQARSIPVGSRIYIAPMGGFEMFLAAAIDTKKVPVQITLDPKTASYFLLTAEQAHEGWSADTNWSARWDNTSGEASGHHHSGTTEKFEESILLVDVKTKDVVWAHQTGNEIGGFKTGGRQLQAERWANRFKRIVK